MFHLAFIFQEGSIVPTKLLTIVGFFQSDVSYYAKYFRLPESLYAIKI